MKAVFAEFEKSSKTDWEARAQADLKGKRLDELNWMPFSHLSEKVKPYYCREDLDPASITLIDNFHSSMKGKAAWRQLVSIDTSANSTQGIIDLCRSSGADGLILTGQAAAILSKYKEVVRDEEVFSGRISFKPNNFARFLNLVTEEQVNLSNLTIITSNHHEDLLASWDNLIKRDFLGCYTLSIGSGLSNQGKGDIGVDNQLLQILETLNIILNRAVQDGLEIMSILPHLVVITEIGTSFFPEIAKIRALHILIRATLKAYGCDEGEIRILASSKCYRNADLSPHENMLKSTYSSMSAIIGGCDDLVIETEDDQLLALQTAIELSQIMRYEANLDKVSDPSAGSYYIDTLTVRLVEGVWGLFATKNQTESPIET